MGEILRCASTELDTNSRAVTCGIHFTFGWVDIMSTGMTELVTIVVGREVVPFVVTPVESALGTPTL